MSEHPIGAVTRAMNETLNLAADARLAQVERERDEALRSLQQLADRHAELLDRLAAAQRENLRLGRDLALVRANLRYRSEALLREKAETAKLRARLGRVADSPPDPGRGTTKENE